MGITHIHKTSLGSSVTQESKWVLGPQSLRRAELSEAVYSAHVCVCGGEDTPKQQARKH